MDDAELVAGCIRGHPRAWEELLDVFGPGVHESARYTLRRVLGRSQEEDVDNVVQGVFLGLCDKNFHRLRLFQNRSTLKTWLTSVTTRFALNYIRTEKRKGSLKLGPIEDAADDLVAPGAVERLTSEERDLLFQTIDLLPLRDRLLIKLFYFDGLSYKEISDLAGIPVNSISPLLNRAKEELKRRVETRS